MANALVDLIKSGDRDALNAYLLNQQIGGDSSGVSINGQNNNALTSLVRPQQPQMQSQVQQQQAQPSQQPMNTIINDRTGRYVMPSGGEESAQPAPFQSQPMQRPQGSPVDVMGQGKGYMQPDGTIVGINAQGQQFKVQPSGTEEARQAKIDQGLKRQMLQAQIADTQAQVQQRHQMGGEAGKPTFNAEMGGYVYPPSAENPQGRFVQVAGATKPEKPLNEYQGQSVSYGTRAADSHNLLNSIETKINTSGLSTKQGLENMPLVGGIAGGLANYALSPDQQRVDQAQRNFINATLRRESGATISPSEFDNAQKQYLVRPGDSQEVITQKRRNRDLVIKGLARSAGPGSRDIQEVIQNNPYSDSNTKDIHAAADAIINGRQ